MKRRGFLGMLLSAPVVATIAAKTFASEEALKQEAIAVGEQLGYENPGMFTAMASRDVDYCGLVTVMASRDRGDTSWLDASGREVSYGDDE